MRHDIHDDPSQLADECLAYLLGEMPDQTRTEFEARLSDPQVAETLERESELLVRLSQSDLNSPALPSSAALLSSPRSFGWLFAVAAAILLLAGVAWQTRPPHAETLTATTLEMKIAQAWADSATLTSEELAIEDSTWIVTEVSEDEPLNDSIDSLDWMVAAVEVEAFEEDQNDG
ncbi:MAG: hypothetical protein AAFU85_06305 [Planctomycetota bacterium]